MKTRNFPIGAATGILAAADGRLQTGAFQYKTAELYMSGAIFALIITLTIILILRWGLETRTA